MPSALSVTSPRNCHGLSKTCPAAAGWPASHAISAFGSLASTLAEPAKPIPFAAGSSRPLTLTLVKPGARKSSRSSRHAAPSERKIAAERLQHGAAERHRVDAHREADRDRQAASCR